MTRALTSILTLIATAASCCGQLAFNETEIVVEAGLLDEQAEVVFTFSNQGKNPVRILRVESSCGCTVPELSKDSFIPGEEGQIKAVFTFGARVGPQSKRITVFTDRPDQPMVHLQLTTNIPEWVVLDPRILRWKVGDQPEPVQVRLKLADPALVKISPPPQPARLFTIRMDPIAADEYLLTVTPLSTTARATEFIQLNATVSAAGESRTRPVGIHCLVR